MSEIAIITEDNTGKQCVFTYTLDPTRGYKAFSVTRKNDIYIHTYGRTY